MAACVAAGSASPSSSRLAVLALPTGVLFATRVAPVDGNSCTASVPGFLYGPSGWRAFPTTRVDFPTTTTNPYNNTSTSMRSSSQNTSTNTHARQTTSPQPQVHSDVVVACAEVSSLRFYTPNTAFMFPVPSTRRVVGGGPDVGGPLAIASGTCSIINMGPPPPPRLEQKVMLPLQPPPPQIPSSHRQEHEEEEQHGHEGTERGAGNGEMTTSGPPAAVTVHLFSSSPPVSENSTISTGGGASGGLVSLPPVLDNLLGCILPRIEFEVAILANIDPYNKDACSLLSSSPVAKRWWPVADLSALRAALPGPSGPAEAGLVLVAAYAQAVADGRASDGSHHTTFPIDQYGFTCLSMEAGVGAGGEQTSSVRDDEGSGSGSVPCPLGQVAVPVYRLTGLVLAYALPIPNSNTTATVEDTQVATFFIGGAPYTSPTGGSDSIRRGTSRRAGEDGGTAAVVTPMADLAESSASSYSTRGRRRTIPQRPGRSSGLRTTAGRRPAVSSLTPPPFSAPPPPPLEAHDHDHDQPTWAGNKDTTTGDKTRATLRAQQGHTGLSVATKDAAVVTVLTHFRGGASGGSGAFPSSSSSSSSPTTSSVLSCGSATAASIVLPSDAYSFSSSSNRGKMLNHTQQQVVTASQRGIPTNTTNTAAASVCANTMGDTIGDRWADAKTILERRFLPQPTSSTTTTLSTSLSTAGASSTALTCAAFASAGGFASITNTLSPTQDEEAFLVGTETVILRVSDYVLLRMWPSLAGGGSSSSSSSGGGGSWLFPADAVLSDLYDGLGGDTTFGGGGGGDSGSSSEMDSVEDKALRSSMASARIPPAHSGVYGFGLYLSSGFLPDTQLLTVGEYSQDLTSLPSIGSYGNAATIQQWSQQSVTPLEAFPRMCPWRWQERDYNREQRICLALSDTASPSAAAAATSEEEGGSGYDDGDAASAAASAAVLCLGRNSLRSIAVFRIDHTAPPPTATIASASSTASSMFPSSQSSSSLVATLPVGECVLFGQLFVSGILRSALTQPTDCAGFVSPPLPRDVMGYAAQRLSEGLFVTPPPLVCPPLFASFTTTSADTSALSSSSSSSSSSSNANTTTCAARWPSLYPIMGPTLPASANATFDDQTAFLTNDELWCAFNQYLSAAPTLATMGVTFLCSADRKTVFVVTCGGGHFLANGSAASFYGESSGSGIGNGSSDGGVGSGQDDDAAPPFRGHSWSDLWAAWWANYQPNGGNSTANNASASSVPPPPPPPPPPFYAGLGGVPLLALDASALSGSGGIDGSGLYFHCSACVPFIEAAVAPLPYVLIAAAALKDVALVAIAIWIMSFPSMQRAVAAVVARLSSLSVPLRDPALSKRLHRSVLDTLRVHEDVAPASLAQACRRLISLSNTHDHHHPNHDSRVDVGSAESPATAAGQQHEGQVQEESLADRAFVAFLLFYVLRGSQRNINVRRLKAWLREKMHAEEDEEEDDDELRRRRRGGGNRKSSSRRNTSAHRHAALEVCHRLRVLQRAWEDLFLSAADAATIAAAAVDEEGTMATTTAMDHHASAIASSSTPPPLPTAERKDEREGEDNAGNAQQDGSAALPPPPLPPSPFPLTSAQRLRLCVDAQALWGALDSHGLLVPVTFADAAIDRRITPPAWLLLLHLLYCMAYLIVILVSVIRAHMASCAANAAITATNRNQYGGGESGEQGAVEGATVLCSGWVAYQAIFFRYMNSTVSMSLLVNALIRVWYLPPLPPALDDNERSDDDDDADEEEMDRNNKNKEGEIEKDGDSSTTTFFGAADVDFLFQCASRGYNTLSSRRSSHRKNLPEDKHYAREEGEEKEEEGNTRKEEDGVENEGNTPSSPLCPPLPPPADAWTPLSFTTRDDTAMVTLLRKGPDDHLLGFARRCRSDPFVVAGLLLPLPVLLTHGLVGAVLYAWIVLPALGVLLLVYGAVDRLVPETLNTQRLRRATSSSRSSHFHHHQNSNQKKDGGGGGGLFHGLFLLHSVQSLKKRRLLLEDRRRRRLGRGGGGGGGGGGWAGGIPEEGASAYFYTRDSSTSSITHTNISTSTPNQISNSGTSCGDSRGGIFKGGFDGGGVKVGDEGASTSPREWDGHRDPNRHSRNRPSYRRDWDSDDGDHHDHAEVDIDDGASSSTSLHRPLMPQHHHQHPSNPNKQNNHKIRASTTAIAATAAAATDSAALYSNGDQEDDNGRRVPTRKGRSTPFRLAVPLRIVAARLLTRVVITFACVLLCQTTVNWMVLAYTGGSGNRRVAYSFSIFSGSGSSSPNGFPVPTVPNTFLFQHVFPPPPDPNINPRYLDPLLPPPTAMAAAAVQRLQDSQYLTYLGIIAREYDARSLACTVEMLFSTIQGAMQAVSILF